MKSIHSLKLKLMIMIIGFLVLTVILSSFVITNLIIEDTKEDAAINTKYWAELIANTHSTNLVNDETTLINDYLSMLKHVPYIRHVHIYKTYPQPKGITFFTSYNKNSIGSAIPEKSDKIAELSTAKFSAHIIELIVPIIDNDKKIGYVYLQVNSDHIQQITNDLFLRYSLVIFIFILIAALVSITLNRFITTPMSEMASKIQEISKHKKFNLRIEQMPFKELDILARNINIVLNRAETQIAKLSDAKQLTYQQNQDLEGKVNKRTQALKDSNNELLSTLEKLHQFQGQLVESEKMASLGDMVAGVAHEVNTPIGLGVTASTLLSDRLIEIKKAFDDKTLKSSQLKKFLVEGEENTAIIYRNLKRAAELIASFKKVAVDQSSEEARTFNIKNLFDDILLTLAPQVKKLPFIINVNCPSELVIKSKPGPINQIIINLIQNSINHGFDDRDHGEITIKISITSDMLTIDYQDDGRGIEPSIINKVFEPFTTTKRGSGGSGLGLHLVYNLVTQALGGKISFSSEIEKGVNFKIIIPTQVIKED
ncbi:sensor histidine kinase [Colwellia hornerae]|nr:HAMP domain-containing sensor histidine kinase [Colwellia hornerae]